MEITWHFAIEDIDDLPSASKPQQTNLSFAPTKDDLITFPKWPDIRFVVLFREIHLSRDASLPISIHVHLSRLRLPDGE